MSNDSQGAHAEPTLTDFLLARIFEREAMLRYAEMIRMDSPLATVAEMLAECEAKRRIVDLHREWDDNDWQSPAYFSAPMDAVLAALALPYADHADFKEEWRP